MSDNRNRDLRRLLETIQRGNCVLVLGPGVATNPADASGEPLTCALARALAKELRGGLPFAGPATLSYVAQLYEQELDRTDLELAIDDFYRPFETQTGELFRHLAALPFRLCIQTTPDQHLANAFREVGKRPQLDHYNFRKPGPASFRSPEAEAPAIYQLYGSREELGSLVVTENDLLDFLANVIRGTPALASYVTSELSDPDTSFLFLGFGFERWNARILLHALQTYGRRNRSLALEGESFFGHPEHDQLALFFQRTYRLAFSSQSWADFAGELRQQYERNAESTAEDPEPPADAPLVFLCHHSPNAEAVAQVGRGLRRLGVRTWRDREQLRGGDDWDRRIEHVLGKQVDYVLVLQSPEMAERVESYFHKEVRVALGRQERFARDGRFVIPARLAECQPLPDLEHLHNVDLFEHGGIETVAAAIRSDWAERNRGSSRAYNSYLTRHPVLA